MFFSDWKATTYGDMVTVVKVQPSLCCQGLLRKLSSFFKNTQTRFDV